MTLQELPPIPDLDAPIVAWAQWYARLGWAVFPCKGKKPAFPSAHKRGDPLYGKCKGACGRVGHGFHDATLDLATIEVWFWAKEGEPLNIGTPTTNKKFALDVDPRNGGDATLRELERLYGPLPRTCLCHTGGGGEHHYWQEPPQGFKPGKVNLGPGLDIQNEGHYTILPPSIHPDTDQPYRWEPDFSPDACPPQPTPEWLIVLIADAQKAASSRPGREDAATSRIAPGEPIPEGQREKTLMSIAGAMRRQGATEGGIRAALGEENLRCVPPLDASDLDRMAGSVMRYDPAPPLPTLIVPPPGVNGTAPPLTAHQADTSQLPPPPDWRKSLIENKTGPTENVSNISLILEHAYPPGSFWWDSVRQHPMFDQARIEEPFLVELARWLGAAERMPVRSLHLVERCVFALCHRTPRDVLQEWLAKLPTWDKTTRLTEWLHDVAEAPKDAYGMDIARLLPVSMVARALNPGCQYRYVVVLEGPEDSGKTKLVRTLAGEEWYTSLSNSLEGKESHMRLQGAWVAEFSELYSLLRTDPARLKDFITLQVDDYIPKYSNLPIRRPRRTIFVGTVNPDVQGYLRSQTGDTRFFPITTGKIDCAKLAKMRQQLFAEALVYYHKHLEGWWQISSEGTAQALVEREKRREYSVYEPALGEWLESGRFDTPEYDNGQPVRFTKDETTWAEIARWFIKTDTPEKWKDKSLQMQIATALKALGWTRASDGARRFWRKEVTTS